LQRLFERRELSEGVELLSASDAPLGISRRAAAEGISAVVFSRILMASPGMGRPLSHASNQTTQRPLLSAHDTFNLVYPRLLRYNLNISNQT